MNKKTRTSRVMLEEETINWSRTKTALKSLLVLLRCTLCDKDLIDAHSFSICNHYFCRKCALDLVDNGKECPNCNIVLWREHMQAELIIPDVIATCKKLQVLLHQENDEINKKKGESLVEAIPDDVNGDENTYVFSCLDVQKVAPTDNIVDDELNIQKEVEAEDVNSNSSMEVDQHTNFISRDCVNIPLQFQEVNEKPTHSICEPLNTSCLASPPKSQFSSVLSDIEIQNGVQMNPGGARKRPKITYGKQKKPIKLKNVQDKTLSLQYSIFDFPSASMNTITVKEDEVEKEVNCCENTSVDTSLHSENNLDINRKVRRRRKNCLIESKTKSIQNKFPGDHKNAHNGNTTTRKVKPKNIEKRNRKGETPLHTACIKGEYERARELIELGADPNTKDFAGWTPLHEACNHGQYNIVQLLLSSGALIDMVGGEDNDTPLHDAVSNNRLEVAELLLQKGAPTHIRNGLGWLPIDLAQDDKMRDIFKNADLVDNGKVDDKIIDSMTSTVLPKVFLATGLNGNEKGIVQKCAKLLNASIKRTFDETVTHVICKCDDSGFCTARTYKYLIGLLTGKWIVSFQWLDDSLKKKKWLPELDYEVKGVAESTPLVPKKSRLNRYKSLPELFHGCSFYLSGNFGESPSKAQLIELLKLGGGKILHREPKANEVDPLIVPVSPSLKKLNLLSVNNSPMTIYHAKETSSQACCTEYIIYDVHMNPTHKRISSPVLCTAPVSWLFDCISNFEIVDVRDGHETKKGLTSSQT